MVDENDTYCFATFYYATGNFFVFATWTILSRWVIMCYSHRLCRFFQRHFQQHWNINYRLTRTSLRQSFYFDDFVGSIEQSYPKFFMWQIAHNGVEKFKEMNTR